MILVRDVFHVDPEHLKDAKDLTKQLLELDRKLGFPASRVLSDLTGEYYTLVVQSEHASLAEYERALAKVFADPEWQATYPRLRKHLRGGRREIYTVIV